MAPSDIRKADIAAAMAEYDALGQAEFLARYDFGPSTKFRIVHDGMFYDSKAIVGVAHGFATGEFWTKDRPNGGVGPSGAVTIAEKLGFHVDHGEFLQKLTQLHVDRTHGRPGPYQHVVLLWAIARARTGGTRLVLFNDVRAELAKLLAPFAIATTTPDPAMPWAALGNRSSRRTGWWERERLVEELDQLTDADVKRMNLLGGLTQSAYWKAAQEDDFVDAAVDVVARIIGDEPPFVWLLDELGLTKDAARRAPRIEPPSVDVDDAIAAVESVAHPRRRTRTAQFSAAEKKAIEVRAVRVTRDHFEELGYATTDVGATESYDVHVTRASEVIKVEVKGTTTNGAAVVLTRNEVALHLAEHPHNALALVRRIALDRSGNEPVGTNGELVLVMPWEIEVSALDPIAYDYQTGL